MSKTFENPDFAAYAKVKDDNTIEKIFILNLIDGEDDTTRINTCVEIFGSGNWIRIDTEETSYQHTYDPATGEFIAPESVEEPVTE